MTERSPAPAPLVPTEETIEGPFYRPGSPLLEPPHCLVRRPAERGAVLVFCGTVSSAGGALLPGALLDVWHASAQGLYSQGAEGRASGGPVPLGYDAHQPPFNFRGRFPAGPDGSFEVTSRIPGAYRDPPGSLRDTAIRPAHLHVRISHPGHVTLTTQIFFAEDPHRYSDPAEVVRPSLVTPLERRSDPADLAARGLLRPYFACRYRFVLAAQAG